jgi:hypothetical protein
MAFGLFNFHMDNDGDAELISVSDSTPPIADPSTSPTIEGNPSTTMLLAPSEEEPRLETSTPSVGSNDFQDRRTYVAFGTSRLARGRNQNKIRLDHILLRRGRRLREVLQCGIPNVLLLRVGGLLEGGIMGSKLESITFTQARRSLLSRRSEVCNVIKTRRNHPGKKFDSKSLTTYQGRSLEESSSPLAEEDECPEVGQESPRHHRRPRKENVRQAPLNLRLSRHSRASSKPVTSWAWRILILLEPRRIHAQDIHHLWAEADSIRLPE